MIRRKLAHRDTFTARLHRQLSPKCPRPNTVLVLAKLYHSYEEHCTVAAVKTRIFRANGSKQQCLKPDVEASRVLCRLACNPALW